MSCVLTESVEKVHTTRLGAERIGRNLGLSGEDAVEWCRSAILDKDAVIRRRGKNWYVHTRGYVITVNAGRCTIITVHKEM